jgi:glycosyltransferase involved in cell wall biosynthesis
MTETRVSPAPAVSIIIPAYNTAAFIGNTIASVLAQTYTDYEIVVVNDASPDTPETERALAPYRDRIIYIVLEQNRGLAGARNAGIRVARGRYIALLDSDDEWEPTYLAEQVAVMESDPSLAVLYPDARIIGDHPHAGRTFMDVCPSHGQPTFRSVLTQRCNVFVSVLARREALVRVGLFDESLRSVEDFDLWMRLLASGARMRYHRRVLARHRKRRDSLSANPIWMAQTVVRVLDKLAARVDLAPGDRAAVTERRAYFRAMLDLAEGKHAFFRLETDAALEHLERANAFFKSRRLRLVCALMRTFPGVLLRVYRLRDRLLLGADTSF